MPNYTYDDEGVLKNKFGVTDARTLEELEARFVAARRLEISEGHGPKGQFDSEHLKALHHHLFQDVYEWAGHTRDERVTLSDGTVASEPIMSKVEGMPFEQGTGIGPKLDELGERLKQGDYLKGLPRQEFADRAADFMAELNNIHPFREGNGRAQRAFMTELAKEAGHSLDFSVISQERMTQASIEAHERGDTGMMRRLFQDASSAERAAALHQAIDFLEEQKFPWNDRYIATLEPNCRVELAMAGVAGENFMGRTRTEILIGKVADLPNPRPQRGETFAITASRWDRDEQARPVENRSQTKTHRQNPLRVLDVATGAVDLLSNFVDALLGGKPTLPPEGVARIQAQRRALAAIERMAESLERGDNLTSSDVAALTPSHLENIKAKGDAGVVEMIKDAARWREKYLGQDLER